jgi:hypothetical protein
MPPPIIPSEIWIKVFSNLERHQLYALGKVCRAFRFSSRKAFDDLLRAGNGRYEPKLLLCLDQGTGSQKANYKLAVNRIEENWVLFSLIDDNFGFKGLSRRFLDICQPLFSDALVNADLLELGEIDDGGDKEGPRKPFRKDLFRSMGQFLTNGWDTLEVEVPSYLRIAYGTLFRFR